MIEGQFLEIQGRNLGEKSLRESTISHLTIMERLLNDNDFPIVCTLSY